MKFQNIKKIAFISLIVILNIARWAHANDFFVVDEEFYLGGHPPILLERKPKYVELYIAPADSNGLSYNRFKKVNATGLKQLFVINSVGAKFIDSFSLVFNANENLDHSLSENPEAKKIEIDIIEPDAVTDFVLEAFIRPIGIRAEISIQSSSGSIQDRLNASKLCSAAEDIIIDDEFYLTQNAFPPILIEKKPGYFELHIAPADKSGLSLNKFKKFDTTNLTILFLINNEDRNITRNWPSLLNANKNLEYSLSENLRAETIRIEISNSDSLAGTFLQGLIKGIGKRADLEILSEPGVSIDGAFFTNINHLYVQSIDATDYDQCSSFPCARNIRIGSLGMHADSPVTFNSKHFIVDGPIVIPNKGFFFDVQGTCAFTAQGTIEKLGLLDAVCKEAFHNNGNIKVQGPAYLTTSNFINEALWDWSDWTPEMIEALPEQLRRGYFEIDEWQMFPFDDILGRKYETLRKDTGIMSASLYQMKVNNDGDFKNINGAQIYATAPSPARSEIDVDGQILNMHKKALNQAGYLKEGFDFISSIIDLAGNGLLYSNTSQILNSASTINVIGNCTAKAFNIVNTNAEGSYLDFLTGKPHGRPKNGYMSTDQFNKQHCAMPGKGPTCLHWWIRPFINELENIRYFYANKNTPAIFNVNGTSYRETIENINDRGSICFSGKDSTDKVGGKYILDGRPIDPVSRETARQRFMNLHPQEAGSVPITQFINNAISLTTHQPHSYFGFSYTQGKANIESQKGVELNAGIHASQEGTDIQTDGNLEMTGVVDSYIAKEIHNKNEHAIIHGFIAQPAIILTGGDLNMEAANGKLQLKGSQTLSNKDTTITAKEVAICALTGMAEDTYSNKKNSFLSSTKISSKKSASETIQTGIVGTGTLKINADHLYSEGGIIEGQEGTELNVKKLDVVAHIVDHYHITDTKVKGLSFPGVGNLIIDAVNGDLTSNSYRNNIGIYAAFDKLLKTESASDMAPSILMATEAYTIADNLANEYQQTGSELAAMTSTVLDQLGLTTINGMPVPSSMGVYKSKIHNEKKWQEDYSSRIGGKNIEINVEEANISGAQLAADENLVLKVGNNLNFNGQPLASSNIFTQKGKSFTASASRNGIGASGTVQSANANSNVINYLLPKIFAGNSITIEVGADTNIEGILHAPKVKINVAGKLNIRTLQDTGSGTVSQQSTRGGVSLTSSGYVIPTGGFQKGNGDWFRNWASQQAGIEADKEVEMYAKNLILEGARILGKMGYVNAEDIQYSNIQNIYESDFSSYGVDTNFLNFLVKPENAFRVMSASNAIKGMLVVGNEEDSSHQTLFATISKDLKVETTSNIDDLNRDDSKSQGPVHENRHKFSLAIPVVDWQQLGEGLERIGMTAREINQKRLDAFRLKNEELAESQPEQAAQWEEVLESQEKVSQKIEQSDLSEKEKEELAKRIFLLFMQPGQYFVHAKSQSTEQGTLTVTPDSNGSMDAIYQPAEGIILTVDKSTDYDADTYNRVAEILGGEIANDLKEAKSIWDKIGVALLNLGKDVLIASIEPLARSNLDSAVIFEAYVEVLKDPENQEIIMQAGTELAFNAYESIVNGLTHPQVQGGLKVLQGVTEIAGAKIIAGGGVLTGVGAIPAAMLATAIATHGIDQISTGSSAILMNEKVPTVTSGALEELGFSPKNAEIMDFWVEAGIPFAGSFKFLKLPVKNVEVGNGVRRTVQENFPMTLKAETSPRVIGFVEREMNTATNPLKIKQIPASFTKEFETGGSWIMTEADYEMHFLDKNWIGRSDGQFMTSCKRMNEAIKDSGGDIEKLQTLFSTNNWKGKTLYRIDIKNPLDYNPRIPHSGLSGANEHFIPGGLTKGGVPEIVTDPFPKSQTTAKRIN